MCVTGEVYDKIPQGSLDLNNGIQWLTKPFCRAIVISIHLILSLNAQTTIAFIGIGKGVYLVGYPILGLLHTTIYLRAIHDVFIDPTGTRFSTLMFYTYIYPFLLVTTVYKLSCSWSHVDITLLRIQCCIWPLLLLCYCWWSQTPQDRVWEFVDFHVHLGNEML